MCTQTIVASSSAPNVAPQTTVNQYEVCDADLKQIDGKNETYVTQSGNITITTKENISCK